MATVIIGYIIYLLLVFVINAAVIYHFSKYCFPGDITKVVIFLYVLIMFSVVGTTFFLIGVV